MRTLLLHYLTTKIERYWKQNKPEQLVSFYFFEPLRNQNRPCDGIVTILAVFMFRCSTAFGHVLCLFQNYLSFHTWTAAIEPGYSSQM